MINSQRETIIKEIKHYQEDRGGNDLINDLFMMNGRIIRQVNPTEKQQIPSLKTAKEQFLETWPEITINAQTTITEYLTRLTKVTATAETQDLKIKKTWKN